MHDNEFQLLMHKSFNLQLKSKCKMNFETKIELIIVQVTKQ